MLGLGLGVTRQSYPAEENPIIYFRQSDFSNGLDTAEPYSVDEGTLTLTYGETAPGSVYDDWLKGVFSGADQASLSGVLFNNFVGGSDTFIQDYDNDTGYFIAVAFDVYLVDGFDGDAGTTVRNHCNTGGSSFNRGIDGVTTEVDQDEHVRECGSRSDDGTGKRWSPINTVVSNGDIRIEFPLSSDYPVDGGTFYIRNLRVAISTQDLGLQIPNPSVKTITYESDFSSTVDGWSTHLAPDSALAAGVTAHGFDDLLEWSWSDDEVGSGYIKKTLDSRVDQHGSKIDKNTTLQREITVDFDVFYEDSTDPPVPPTGITIGVGGFTDIASATGITINEWISKSVTITLDDASTDIIYLGIAVANDLPNAGDKIYFKNIKVSFPTIDPEP